MSFKQHKFGRYIILEPLAVGGMAEIFLAKLGDEDVDVPVRILVIKKVISSYSGNEDFVSMFEDEIKITVGLSHQCIVQIYDYGRVEGISFLAMEYVEGKTLRQILVRLLERKSNFAIDVSCYVISQVASALAYAHSFQDRVEGEHLGIVHRDISPQNIMVSYGGAVKLFDFGIAKAKSTAQETRAGIIKGKPSYLSPEQIAGEVLDGRSDIFALGVVFWEALTGRRLFYGDNDINILRMIQKEKIELPSIYNPEVPPELDAIVLQTLHRNKNKRYQKADDVQRELHAFIYSYNPKFNPTDLGHHITELFRKEAVEAKQALKIALEICRKEGINQHGGSKGFKDLDMLFDQNRQTGSTITSFRRSSAKGKSRVKFSPGSKSQRSFTKRPSQAKDYVRHGRNEENVIPPWPSQGKGMGEIDLSKSYQEDQFKIAPATQVIRRRKSFMSVNREINSFFLLVLIVIPPMLFLVFGTNEKKEERTETSGDTVVANTATTTTPATTTQVKPVVAEDEVVEKYAPTKLHFQTSMQEYTVYLNNRRVKIKQNTVLLPKQRPVRVRIVKNNYQDINFSIQERSSRNITRPLAFKKLSYGFLTLTTEPGADITIEARGRDPASAYSPLRSRRLPVGTYNILIENQLIGYKETIQITIKKGETVQIHKDLE